MEVPNRVRASAARRAIWNGVARIAWAKCVGSKKNISGILGLPRNKQAVSRPETEDTLHSRCSFYQNFTAVKSIQTNILSQVVGSKRLPTWIVNFFLTQIN